MRNPSAPPTKPDVIRRYILQYTADYTQAGLTVTRAKRGAVQGEICRLWPEPEIRHRCMWWLMGAEQSTPDLRMKDVPDAAILALARWIGAYKDDTSSTWEHAPQLETEALWISWEAEKVAKLIAQGLLLVAQAVNLGGKITETQAIPEKQERMTFDD